MRGRVHPVAFLLVGNKCLTPLRRLAAADIKEQDLTLRQMLALLNDLRH